MFMQCIPRGIFEEQPDESSIRATPGAKAAIPVMLVSKDLGRVIVYDGQHWSMDESPADIDTYNPGGMCYGWGVCYKGAANATSPFWANWGAPGRDAGRASLHAHVPQHQCEGVRQELGVCAMKKFIVLCALLALCLSLAACTDPMGKYGNAIEDSKEQIEKDFGKLQEELEDTYSNLD